MGAAALARAPAPHWVCCCGAPAPLPSLGGGGSDCARSPGRPTVLDFRAAALPGRWRVIVREFDPPFRFVDAQVVGPFARWEHRHRFTEGEAAEGGTWVEDRVTYRLPLGPLGRLVHALGAGGQVRRLFDHRDRRLRALFAAG